MISGSHRRLGNCATLYFWVERHEVIAKGSAELAHLCTGPRRIAANIAKLTERLRWPLPMRAFRRRTTVKLVTYLHFEA
jgi:hypothetical protein